MTALAGLPRYSKPWLKWRWAADYQNYAVKSRLSDPEPYLVPGDEARVAFASFNDPGPDTAPDSAWYIMDRSTTYLLEGPDDPPVTDGPGVYAIYSADRERLYVKSARGLSSRVRADLGRTPATAKKSELCRRLAERLGIASAAEIEAGSYVLSADDIRRLRRELSNLRIGAQEAVSFAAARLVERNLLAEFKPPLNGSG